MTWQHTGSMELVTRTVQHIPLFTGSVWYVDAAQADDAGAGNSPDTAKRTIGGARAVAAAGDAITVKAGTYAENVVMDLDALELWCEIGTFIAPATGVALTVSGDSCRVRGILWVTAVAGQVAVSVSGDYCNFCDVVVIGGTVGFDVTGSGCFFFNCRAGQQTVTAYDIRGAQGVYDGCNTVGIGATRGFYINGGADTGVLLGCTSTGHTTAGFTIAAGSQDWTMRGCTSGGGDGDRVDDGTGNMWAAFVDRMATEHHEHIYPASDGEGTAGAPVTVSNSTTNDAGGTTDDQDYWGDTVRVIPLAVLTSVWMSLGIYIDAIATADDQQWEAFFPQVGTAQDSGNDWDTDETVLTVADGSLFQADDLVWLTGDDVPDGEIQVVVSSVANVVTVVSETRIGGGVGLRYDYDVAPGNNRLYLVYRATDRMHHGFRGAYSAASAKDFARFVWHDPKEIAANGAMIMRMLNASDALGSSFGARAIYED